MVNDEIVEMPQPLGIFAGDLFLRGKEFLEAFEKLSDEGENTQTHAQCFLLVHAFELFLKSYLAAKGVPKLDLRRKHGHNLPSILAECSERSLPNVTNLKAFIGHFHEMNKDFDFRYPTSYRLSMPRPIESLRVARQLVQAIEAAVSRAQIEANLEFASSTRHLRGKKVRWSD